MPARLPVFLLLACAVGAQTPAVRFEFDLSSGKVGRYDEKIGYGFEERSGDEGPLYFSVRVPEEGNYRVRVTLGDPRAASVTTVKAELRRLMVEKVETEAGKSETRTFIVNVRTPRVPNGEAVILKDREQTFEAWAWDDKLTLEFIGTRPAVRRIEIEKADSVPTIYIAGDSTSTDQPREPYNSWGQMLTRFFRPEIAVANHGESGESLRGFIVENRLAKLMSVIRPGDYLMVQMGHNDQKETGAGVGAFTTYKTRLEEFVTLAREHGALPVLVTPVSRLTFGADGTITNSLGDFPAAVRQVAHEQSVALIDLNAMSKTLYEALGPERAHVAFAGKDHTHHSDYGSYELAKCVVEAIRRERLPLARYLVDTAAFDPARPDAAGEFDVPGEGYSSAP